LEHNPRTINKHQFEVLKKSIADNPDYFAARPIICSDRTGELVIIAGNQRYKAARALKLEKVPVHILSSLTDQREKEIIIRDNVENGEWNMDVLANEWDSESLHDWGIEMPEYKEIVEDSPAPADHEHTCSIVGEIYKLGTHRMFCGSFEDDEKIRELFGGKKATCTFTDPPYNINYVGKTKGRKAIMNDNLTHNDFQLFLDRVFECVAANMVTGGGVISWMSDSEILTLKQAFDNAGLGFKTIICWVKSQFTLGRGDFQNGKELAIYGLGEGKYCGDAEDTDESQYAAYARGGRSKFTSNRQLSNVWFFKKPKESAEHPTMKPIGLCAKGILALSDRSDIVFDPFLGSGSVLIAAEQTGRVCYGCEIDPGYCDVIRKRYHSFVTGSEAGWENGTKAV
jgi:DNA modification methylase